jgi:hypothetical protein
MLHTKALVTKQTNNWRNLCGLSKNNLCKLGVPFPQNTETNAEALVEFNFDSSSSFEISANCYPHVEIENIWVPKLTKALQDRLSKQT